MKKIKYLFLLITSVLIVSNNNVLMASTRSGNKLSSANGYNYTDAYTYNFSCTIPATGTIKNMSFKQDVNNYYLTYDIDYVSSESYDKTLEIGTVNNEKAGTKTKVYQSINPGNIILTKLSNSGITLYHKYNYRTQTGSSYSWSRNYYTDNGKVSANNVSTNYEFDVYYTSDNEDTDIKTANTNSYLSTPIAGLSNEYYAKRENMKYWDTKNSCYNYYSVYLCKSGGASITQTPTLISNTVWAYNYKGVLTIPKAEVNDFKYLQLNVPEAVMTKDNSNIYEYKSNYDKAAKGIYGTAFELTKYLECSAKVVNGVFTPGNNTHNYVYVVNADGTHTKKCSSCGLELKENHSFIYEYDGIQNNVCECGGTKKVNVIIEINDDSISTKSNVIDSNSNITSPTMGTKTGYVFKYFEKYEKRFENEKAPIFSDTSTSIKEVKVGNVNAIDTKVGNYSVRYKAIYEPITYTFKYSNINNKDLNLEGNIADQVFTYDMASKLNKNIDFVGYDFIGWSIEEKSDKVEFEPETQIKNYFDTSKVLTLYPIYSPKKYTIHYSSENSKNLTLEKIEDQVVEYNTSFNLKNNVEVVGYNFLGWTKNKEKSSIDFNANAQIFVNDLEDYNLTIYPIYEPITYTFKYSNINNKQLVLDGALDNQIFTYDSAENLRNNIYYKGYNFIGWSIEEGSEEVVFNANEKIMNYFYEDKKELILYPIYAPIKYTFIYSNINNKNLSLDGNIENQEFIYDAMQKLKDNIDYEGYNFIGWSIEERSEKVAFNANENIENYFYEDLKKLVLYPIYEPIKYTIVYNNINNVNRPITNTLNNEMIEYDKKINLKSNIDLVGFISRGWSIKKGSSDIKYLQNEEIMNLTTIDNDIINLYPIYDQITFKVKYITNEGKFTNGNRNVLKEYTFYDNEAIEMPYDYSGGNGTYFVCYVDEEKNKFSSINDIKNYFNRNKKTNVTLTLTATFNYSSTGTSERTDGSGITPSKEDIGTDTSSSYGPGHNTSGNNGNNDSSSGNGNGGNGNGGNGNGGNGSNYGPGYDIDGSNGSGNGSGSGTSNSSDYYYLYDNNLNDNNSKNNPNNILDVNGVGNSIWNNDSNNDLTNGKNKNGKENLNGKLLDGTNNSKSDKDDSSKFMDLSKDNNNNNLNDKNLNKNNMNSEKNKFILGKLGIATNSNINNGNSKNGGLFDLSEIKMMLMNFVANNKISLMALIYILIFLWLLKRKKKVNA